MSVLAHVFAREARLAWAGGGGAAGPAAFFLAAISLPPLAIGPDLDLLRPIGPGILAFAILLAVLQAAERLFADDAVDGTLELYALMPASPALIAFSKVMGQACASFWPLPFIALAAGVMYGLDSFSTLVMALAMAAGLPGLALIAGFAGALAAGVKRGGLLIALIAIPMMTPVLIFAAGAGRAALDGEIDRAWATLLLTLAVSLAMMAIMPFGIAAAMRSRVG